MLSETEDRSASFDALYALGRCLSAHIHGDMPAVTAAMRDLLDRVHADGEEAARYRIAWLGVALASSTAGSMCQKYGPGYGVFAIFNQARKIHFDELPECDQIAVTSVVASMNGDTEGAGHLIREYASAARCAALSEMLSTLISLHTAAERCERTGAHRRPEE